MPQVSELIYKLLSEAATDDSEKLALRALLDAAPSTVADAVFTTSADRPLNFEEGYILTGTLGYDGTPIETTPALLLESPQDPGYYLDSLGFGFASAGEDLWVLSHQVGAQWDGVGPMGSIVWTPAGLTTGTPTVVLGSPTPGKFILQTGEHPGWLWTNLGTDESPDWVQELRFTDGSVVRKNPKGVGIQLICAAGIVWQWSNGYLTIQDTDVPGYPPIIRYEGRKNSVPSGTDDENMGYTAESVWEHKDGRKWTCISPASSEAIWGRSDLRVENQNNASSVRVHCTNSALVAQGLSEEDTIYVDRGFVLYQSSSSGYWGDAHVTDPAIVESIYIESNTMTEVFLGSLGNLVIVSISSPLLYGVFTSNLPNLSSLDIAGCFSMTSLDVDNNTNLTSLSTNGSGLLSLDLEYNTLLQQLTVAAGIPSIDLSFLPNLEWLSLVGSVMTSVDVLSNTALIEISIENSNIETIDLTNTTELSAFYGNSSALTEIDFTNCPFLAYVALDYCPLSFEPDLTANTALSILSLQGYPLTTPPDLSANTLLDSINLSGSAITTPPDLSFNAVLNTVDLSNTSITAPPDFTGLTTIHYIYLDGAAISSAATINAMLVILDANGAASGVLDISGGTNAAPTGAGLTAITNLEDKYWTIITN